MDIRNVHPSCHNISTDEHALITLTKFVEDFVSFGLHLAMDGKYLGLGQEVFEENREVVNTGTGGSKQHQFVSRFGFQEVDQN